MMVIPQDPVMRLSYINTQLRDRYSSLSELCNDLEASEEEIRQSLKAIDYHYDEVQNQFI